jgi:hypothetical protein
MVPVEKIGWGFPQVGDADPSEIPYSIDPEIWKRCYKLSCDPVLGINGAQIADLYWARAATLAWAASGRGV